MSTFKLYRKKGLQPMRPYYPGEDLTGISVQQEDTPEVGGMIAQNPENEKDRWYVSKDFFEENYEEEDQEGGTVTIPTEEYEDLLESAEWLECLNDAGVDNWPGCDYARELREEA